jgi:6-hydroxycyclohex-1-ene-1-carbonyl-CoA dehydrogenase
MSETARRWVTTAVGEPPVLERFEPAAPGPGEALVAVAGCGVCHTDLGYHFDGVRPNHALPLTLGHEISGRVVAAGPGLERLTGRPVIVPAVMPCNVCDLCRRGRRSLCRAQKMPGNDIHGGFATHVTVPAADLCVVDEARLRSAGLELWQLAVVADAVSTPYQAVHLAEVESGDLAVVVGVGGVGLYCAQLAAAAGALVVAVDVDPRRLAAAEALGYVPLDARAVAAKDLKKVVAGIARERAARATEWKVFECSGAKAGQEAAWSLLVHGATLMVVGFTLDRVEVRLSNLMAFHARALGNWGCAPEHYPAALDLVLGGRVRIAPFVEAHPLDAITRVFDDARAHRLERRPVLIP